ncbi:MAG: hypothetical protein AAFQ69_17940 [Pseudomonadota bacterium]
MELRPPDMVMRLARLGAAHQTRLSFMRVLLRKLRREGWCFDRPVWAIGDDGTGHAVYRVTGPRRSYSLVAFAHDLPDDQRSDRVIAEAWDATFALVDGTPSQDDIARLSKNVPLQEAGRVSDAELVLSRANRSVRLWDHVVERLSTGRQPDLDRVAEVGYLMRTTAVYGSGKFGAADHAALSGRPVMGGPFRAEMLAVWLIRTFVVDLAEHLARVKGESAAVPLDPDLRRTFGIGNSTGLGMAPFLVNHPTLLNAWISARETAIARVRGLKHARPSDAALLSGLVRRTQAALTSWRSTDPETLRRVEYLKADCARVSEHLAKGALDQPLPWDQLIDWSREALSVDGQELLGSLILEPHSDLVDDLADAMSVDESAAFQIAGDQTIAELCAALHTYYGWALSTDYADEKACARFWYTSAAKREPRLGERALEAGGELEQPLDVARAAASLWETLRSRPRDENVASLLAEAPEHRRMVRRAQIVAAAPYAEIRDNLIDAEMRPIDMLRCKLAFFGATRFDPRSDRWLRITMFQSAPYPHELHQMPEDDWIMPTVAR